MKTPASAGALRHRIVLQRRDALPDGAGGALAVFMPYAVAWAQVETATPRGRPKEAAPLAGGQFRVRLRHRADVCPGMRVQWRQRTLEILEAAPMTGDRRFLDLLCREIQDDT